MRFAMRTMMAARLGHSVCARVVGLAVLAALAGPATAQAPFPEKPITIVVGFPAGGGTDLIARGVQLAFEKAAGTQVIVKNVPGASSSIATTEVSQAPPDGYTVHMVSNAFVIQPFRLKVSYDITKFEPVCLMTASPMFVVTTATSKFKSMADWSRPRRRSRARSPMARRVQARRIRRPWRSSTKRSTSN